MPISQALLPEFDHEMSNTRKTLERIPENDFTWKPHPKSMPLGRLAGHVAEMPGWAVPTIAQDSLDLAPPGSPPPQGTVAQSRQHVLDLFDKNVADARVAIAGASDEQLMQPWSLLVGGRTIFTTAENCGAAQHDHKPYHSSPRAIGCLPEVEQHSGARALWAVGG